MLQLSSSERDDELRRVGRHRHDPLEAGLAPERRHAEARLERSSSRRTKGSRRCASLVAISLVGLLGTAACFRLLPLEGDGTDAWRRRRPVDAPQHAAGAAAHNIAAELRELLRTHPLATAEEVRTVTSLLETLGVHVPVAPPVVAAPLPPPSPPSPSPPPPLALARHPKLRLAFTVPWIGKRFPSWFPCAARSNLRSAVSHACTVRRVRIQVLPRVVRRLGVHRRHGRLVLARLHIAPHIGT